LGYIKIVSVAQHPVTHDPQFKKYCFSLVSKAKAAIVGICYGDLPPQHKPSGANKALSRYF